MTDADESRITDIVSYLRRLLTHAVGEHAAGDVDRVSKQTVSRHRPTNDRPDHRSAVDSNARPPSRQPRPALFPLLSQRPILFSFTHNSLSSVVAIFPFTSFDFSSAPSRKPGPALFPLFAVDSDDPFGFCLLLSFSPLS